MKKEDLVLLCIILSVVVIALVVLYKRKESYDSSIDPTLQKCMASCEVQSFNPSKRNACINDCYIDYSHRNSARIYGNDPNF